jgi:transposase
VLAKPRGLPARPPGLRDVVALRATRRQLRDAPEAANDPLLRQVEQLRTLRGIGEVSAWMYATEFFGWRAFRNRRQMAGLAGLTPTTRSSGDLEREQGISKAGNARIRGLAVELPWSWVRRQPASALTRWYRERFAAGGGRQRRIGIVAVARKLLIALWRSSEVWGGKPISAPCTRIFMMVSTANTSPPTSQAAGSQPVPRWAPSATQPRPGPPRSRLSEQDRARGTEAWARVAC